MFIAGGLSCVVLCILTSKWRAEHAICWSTCSLVKIICFAFKQVTNRKKERKAAQKHAKTCNKRGIYQHLGVALLTSF